MDTPGPGRRPQTPPSYVLPKTSCSIFPALHHNERKESDFFIGALMDLGQSDGELARQLVATADRWAREDFPDDEQEYERSNARSRYINMGLFVYKSLERQGLISYFSKMLAVSRPIKNKKQ